MISGVDSAMENQTNTHTLATSHAPYYSQPKMLADLLEGIAQ
jgi:hypothetical protein